MKLMVKNRFVLVRAEIPLSCEYYHVCCSMCETQNLILASYYRNVSLQSCIIVFVVVAVITIAVITVHHYGY